MHCGDVPWAMQPLRVSCAMKRSCQRQTHVFDLPAWRMISMVPSPAAVSSTIRARQTCFCAALRSLVRACRRRRSADETVIEIPLRMRKTRTHQHKWESQKGFSR